jgi:sporulation protein YlmC with PRC-barrel domain
MPAHEVHFELLLDRRVVDSDGDFIGRLEEARAEVVSGECRVLEFHVGKLAVLERLGSVALFGSLIRTLGGKRFYRTYVVPADRMDLSDPGHLRATVPMRELRELRTLQ